VVLCRDLAGLKEPLKTGPGGHDMADVLLSLKHAVVHPGQISGPLSPNSYASPYLQQSSHQLPSAQLSYTVHPHHQVRISNHNNLNILQLNYIRIDKKSA